ncbi:MULTISPECIES: vWA domain-containing protein [Streptomyces]|nr:hypothetical protein [Streptomyces ruber]
MAVGPVRETLPYVAVVYATASGEVACFGGRPLNPVRQLLSRYRTRFEVDMRPRRCAGVLSPDPLVSADGVHCFEVRVSFSVRVAGWQGAEAWVRSGVPDALPKVRGWFLSRFHGVGRDFPIEDSFALERRLEVLCAELPDVLDVGLRVYDCRVSVRPDAASLSYLQSLIGARRREELGKAEHTPNRADVVRKGELDALQDEFAVVSAARQAKALAGTLTTSEGLIRHYLVTHPHDAAVAFDMARRLEEVRAATTEHKHERALDLFRVMAEKDLVRAGDLDRMREQLTGTMDRATGGDGRTASAATPQLSGARPWDAPGTSAPHVPAPYSEEPVPGPQQPTATKAGPGETAASTRFPGTALIYLVLDESLGREYLDELQRGLQNLHATLSGEPDVSAVLRLCVLGMADTTEVRLPLARVGPGTPAPSLVTRRGLSYGRAFRTLRSLVGQDATVVRTESAQVLRPVVYFLTGGVPEEGNAWQAACQELTDRSVNPAAPRMVALGLGRAQPPAVRAVATFPEFAFVAAAHQDAAVATRTLAAFLCESVVGYGRRLAGGEATFTIVPPDGFRPAAGGGHE